MECGLTGLERAQVGAGRARPPGQRLGVDVAAGVRARAHRRLQRLAAVEALRRRTQGLMRGYLKGELRLEHQAREAALRRRRTRQQASESTLL